MRIYSISKVLGLPIVISAIVIMYLSYNRQNEWSIYIFIPAILLVVLYVFHGPLDHWFLSKYPIPIDPKLKVWLEKYFIGYQNLNDIEKNKFEYRLTLYLNGRLFQSVGSELRDVPEDIKCMIAAHGIHMSMGTSDYLLGDMDRIFVYKHPFPTPDFPLLHNVETNTEDGVIIISLEQVTNAVISPKEYYNIAYHAYAEAFIATQKNILYPDCSDSWPFVKKISSWSFDDLKLQTGLENLSLLTVHITLFFSFPEAYKEVLPQHFISFSNIFFSK